MVTGLGTASDTDIVISSTFQDLKVTAIADGAFAADGPTSPETRITSVVIPDSVITIGESAFGYCMGLRSVTIGEGVTEIKRYAFGGCISLSNIIIPKSVTSIGDVAFEYCNKLIEVRNYSDLDIAIGEATNGYVAYYAKNVYTADETSKLTTTDDGFLFYDDDKECYLLGYNGDRSDLTMPEKSPSGKEYGIYQYAFIYCSGLMSITIPDSVTLIGEGAFGGCSGLTSITIPDSVTSIGNSAFYDCIGLTSVTIGRGVSSIGSGIFGGCNKLVEVWNYSNLSNGLISSNSYRIKNIYTTAEKSKQTITDDGFLFYEDDGECYLLGYNGNKTELTLPNQSPSGTEYKLYPYAFYYFAWLTSIVIPDGVISVEDYAFYGCSGLTKVIIGNDVTSIGDYAFDGCSGLTGDLKIPDSVTSIGDYAFDGCSGLTGDLKIPDSVTSIGEWAFCNCYGLTSITIPDSVTSIGAEAFHGCVGLEHIIVAKGNKVYRSEQDCLIEIESKTLITGCKNSVIPDSVTSIGRGTFYYCSGLTSITIPDSVTSIGYFAFSECSGLKSMTIGKGVTSIGQQAFAFCSELTDIQFKGTVKEWQAIKKDFSWNDSTGEYTITCTDGTIDKEGNVTYYNK